MPVGEINKSSKKPISKWLHGLAMFIATPWLTYLASGLFHGFDTLPSQLPLIGLLWAEWLGAVLIPLAVGLIVLIFVSRPTAWAVLLLLVAGWLYLAGFFTTQKPVATGLRPTSQTDTAQVARHVAKVDMPPVRKRLTVTEFVQSSQGVTESDISPEFIAGIEEFLLKDKQAQYERAMRSIGEEPTKGALIANSQVIRESQHRLVVTEITHRAITQSGVATKIAWWIQGDQLKLVQCADTTGAPIALRSGECGHQIVKTFGFSDWLVDR